MRLGVLGGTFDPIHIGHLFAAEEARTRLGLERVLFVPAGLPPHKLDVPVTPVEHRLNMVQLAIADNPHLVLSRVDVDRFGPSYTVDTIELLRDEHGPDTELHFIMGSDSLADLLTWHRPERLIRLCRIVALTRPNGLVDLEELNRLLPGAIARIQMLEMPLLQISSSDLQRRVRAGFSIRYLVPMAVEAYIEQHQLYRKRE
ncbi:MAG: nicotinate-nucleotide adenylyltransferase [Chloroflexota bacterium]